MHKQIGGNFILDHSWEVQPVPEGEGLARSGKMLMSGHGYRLDRTGEAGSKPQFLRALRQKLRSKSKPSNPNWVISGKTNLIMSYPSLNSFLQLLAKVQHFNKRATWLSKTYIRFLTLLILQPLKRLYSSQSELAPALFCVLSFLHVFPAWLALPAVPFSAQCLVSLYLLISTSMAPLRLCQSLSPKAATSSSVTLLCIAAGFSLTVMAYSPSAWSYASSKTIFVIYTCISSWL